MAPKSELERTAAVPRSALTDIELGGKHIKRNVVQSRLDGDRVTAVIIGPSDGAPGAQDLAERLSAELDRTMTADVRLVVEERDTATSDGS